MLRKLALAMTAILALGAATPVLAADSGAAVGGSAGAVTGATAGFFIGGPVGAVVGGVVGAGVGAGVSSSAQDYARQHRVASINWNGNLQPGYRVGHGVRLYPVPSDKRYSYVYVNGQPALIENSSNRVVWVGND